MAVAVQDLHVEAARTFGDFTADTTKAEDAQRGAAGRTDERPVGAAVRVALSAT